MSTCATSLRIVYSKKNLLAEKPASAVNLFDLLLIIINYIIINIIRTDLWEDGLSYSNRTYCANGEEGVLGTRDGAAHGAVCSARRKLVSNKFRINKFKK